MHCLLLVFRNFLRKVQVFDSCLMYQAASAVACNSCNVMAINSSVSVVWNTKLNALLCVLHKE